MMGPLFVPDIFIELSGLLEAAWLWISSTSPEAWSALAAWATTVVAAVAAIFALRQVREARHTRESQAQPNIAVFTEQNETDWQLFELRVKNYGPTGAYHIAVKFEDVLEVAPWQNLQTDEWVTTLPVPTEIAFLAPGQQWLTHWDDATDREEHNRGARNEGRPELKSIYRGHVEFEDRAGRKYCNPILIDCDMYRNTFRVRNQT
ncbi:hypothetical protein [Mycobacteroides abscessus]|uniref:hypothetical protein n=1 Tax=Mycobacteroides abscessus TaxID=36809 RepID=UPI000940C9B3|nr:hypothetical protein [Mycobacteroides abscessus]